MNETHKKILNLLWEFNSLRVEHVLQICNCTEKEINFLIARKAIIKDRKRNILRCNNKELNSKNIVAFDVVMNYLDRNPKIIKGEHPINVTIKTEQFTYDIIAVKEIEVDPLFEQIDEISKADRIIIIIETKQYIRKTINTKRPCYICTYSPLKIVDRLN